MKQIILRDVIFRKFPGLEKRLPKTLKNLFIRALEKVVCIDKINHFIDISENYYNLDFVRLLFQTINFESKISSECLGKIPKEGKLIVVANHPLGALDGLALLLELSKVRPDVKIVANDLLMNLTNVQDLFLPIDLYSSQNVKRNISMISNELKSERALVFFPAAEVSRFKLFGIKDKPWLNGAAKFAKKFDAPIVPIFISGRNTASFYIASFINKSLATIQLPRQVFAQSNKSITMTVGDLILPDSDELASLSPEDLTLFLRQKVYELK